LSDGYEYWFFPELDRKDVGVAKLRVLTTFWDKGWLAQENQPDLTLGGIEAYAPTEKLASLFSLEDRLGGVTLTMRTRGFEVCEGFGFKGWELNEIEQIKCPNCASSHDINDLNIYEMIDVFKENCVIPTVACPSCELTFKPAAWISEPRLSFTYLGFAFWNQPTLLGWPSDGLNPAGEWALDLPQFMSNLVGSPIYRSFGRI